MSDDEEKREIQRRMNSTIGRATACHMSDTKWRKLLGALREFGVGSLRWKFLRDERVFLAHVPAADAVLETCLGDVLPYPYGPYREIDWLEVPAEGMAGVAEALALVGEFPLQMTETGLRVVGYGWDPSN
ncbi:MAG: hypothetical protein ACR2FY_04425 [Pirellulaceae bacterium]